MVCRWENVAQGLKYVPSSGEALSHCICSLRALPALCCQNLGDVPRPGTAHVLANPEQNKPLAGGQEAPSQPSPPPPPSPASASPRLPRPIQYKIFLPQFS